MEWFWDQEIIPDRRPDHDHQDQSQTHTLAGIETAHMIRKGQFNTKDLAAFQQFAELAA
jgi:hypothetical protein